MQKAFQHGESEDALFKQNSARGGHRATASHTTPPTSPRCSLLPVSAARAPALLLLLLLAQVTQVLLLLLPHVGRTL